MKTLIFSIYISRHHVYQREEKMFLNIVCSYEGLARLYLSIQLLSLSPENTEQSIVHSPAHCLNQWCLSFVTVVHIFYARGAL